MCLPLKLTSNSDGLRVGSDHDMLTEQFSVILLEMSLVHLTVFEAAVGQEVEAKGTC